MENTSTENTVKETLENKVVGQVSVENDGSVITRDIYWRKAGRQSPNEPTKYTLAVNTDGLSLDDYVKLVGGVENAINILDDAISKTANAARVAAQKADGTVEIAVATALIAKNITASGSETLSELRDELKRLNDERTRLNEEIMAVIDATDNSDVDAMIALKSHPAKLRLIELKREITMQEALIEKRSRPKKDAASKA
jgi:hypothetical protein